MTTDLKTILNSQMPIGRSLDKVTNNLSIVAVDKLADELIKEYSNPKFRQWYCKVIYEFGYAQVLEWRKRAKEGNYPAKLFSKYVKDAQTFKGRRSA